MKKDVINEKIRDITVEDSYEVIVCGGGPAGVSAAIMAARSGAKTCVIEKHGFLGGVWTASGVSYILDTINKQGLLQELINELEKRKAIKKNVFDNETMKYILDTLCLQAGVDLLLYSSVVNVIVDEENWVRVVITESKSGRKAYKGDIIVDATGDGDIGALAGCKYDYGHPETGLSQPASLLAIVSGIDPNDCEAYIRNGSCYQTAREDLFQLIKEAGHELSYHKPALWHVRDDYYVMMANHQYGVQSDDVKSITIASVEARKELYHMIETLRSLGGKWKDIRLVSTGTQLGIRESRRIHGIYQITSKDLIEGKRHVDAVCEVSFKVDIHSLNPNKGKHYGNDGIIAQTYDIPSKALIAKNVNGLLMAGRCISGDFYAHGSYRVTGNAVPMGEVAGVMASIAANCKVLPQDIEWSIIKQTINKQNIYHETYS